uniref:Uncharacterized protein n=1 Tax=Arundo donax TaxID=35708 RepID=A0A0A9GZF3_ARUDO
MIAILLLQLTPAVSLGQWSHLPLVSFMSFLLRARKYFGYV